MGSVKAFNSLKKTPTKELGLGFDNFVQPEHLNMRSATNDRFANDGINAKFSNKIKNDEFLDPLSTGQEKLGARSCRAPIVHLK